MEAQPRFWYTDSIVLKEANHYRQLLGKLKYLAMTHPNIVYVVGVLSQSTPEPHEPHVGLIHKRG